MYIYLPQDALVIFWRSVFCNTTSTTSSIAPLQHHFCSIVFCSIASTPPLQHHLLQQHFNTASTALSSVALLQHCLCNIIFCSTTSTLEWWQGLGFLVGRR